VSAPISRIDTHVTQEGEHMGILDGEMCGEASRFGQMVLLDRFL